MGMKRYLKTLTVIAAAGMVALGFGCGKKATTGGGAAAQVAIMPGADFVMTMDVEAARGTPFNKTMEAMSEEFEKLAGQVNPDAGDMQELQNKLKQVTGLDDDDIASLAIAIELDAVDFNASEPPKDINAVAAIGLKSALTSAQLGEAIRELAKEEGVEVEEKDVSGVTMYLIPVDDPDAPVDMLATAMVSGDKVCVLGPQQAVEAAIERAQNGTTAELSKELQAVMGAASQGSQMVMGLAMTGQLKQLAAMQAESAPAGPQGAAARSIKSLEGVCVSMLMDNDADVAVTGLFGTVEDAEAMKSFIDSMVISGAKMFVGMMAQGEPMPLLESLKAVSEGSNASFVMTVSEQDVKTFQKLVEQQTQM